MFLLVKLKSGQTLTKIDDKLRKKLVVAGLIDPLPEDIPKVLSPTLKEFTDEFIEKVGGGGRRKPGTCSQWKQVATILVRLMPEGIRIAEITRGHATAYYET